VKCISSPPFALTIDGSVGSNGKISAGKCTIVLSVSGGSGFTSLMIIDSGQLSGKQIYVIRAAGTAASSFTLTVE
jgi:hypothetical protein